MTTTRFARSAPMMRTKPLQQKTPLKRSGFLRRAKEQVTKKVSSHKSRGMKGRTPTAMERRFMDAVAGLGCIACLKDGHVNPWISIHHIDGRTKPGAHFLVLGLCAGHHKQGEGEDKSLIAVHPNRARFEAMYGSQMELLAEAKQKLGLV